MAYTHLSLEERHYIEPQLKEGVSQNKIAKALGRNRGQRGCRHIDMSQYFAGEKPVL